jgi:hypothetical protein
MPGEADHEPITQTVPVHPCGLDQRLELLGVRRL